MFAFLGGLFVGRGLHNSRLPDSVKQQNYDARMRAKAARRGQPIAWSEQGRSPAFRALVLGMIGVAAVIVAAVLIFG